MVTALNIANAILYKGFNEGVDLTPMKLQSFMKQEALDTERPLTEAFIRELNKIILVRP